MHTLAHKNIWLSIRKDAYHSRDAVGLHAGNSRDEDAEKAFEKACDFVELIDKICLKLGYITDQGETIRSYVA